MTLVCHFCFPDETPLNFTIVIIFLHLFPGETLGRMERFPFLKGSFCHFPSLLQLSGLPDVLKRSEPGRKVGYRQLTQHPRGTGLLARQALEAATQDLALLSSTVRQKTSRIKEWVEGDR